MQPLRTGVGAALALLVVCFHDARAGEAVRIGGTGMGLAAMRLIAVGLANSGSDISATILPSLGSGGGIEAMVAGVLDIALSNRRLTPREVENGVRNAACVRTAFVLVTSLATAPDIRRADLAGLYVDPNARWEEGTPVRIVLRSRDDSDNISLIENFPGMEAALQTARLRRDVPIAASDQDNVDFAQQIKGSLTGTTLLQIRAERLKLTPLTFDGIKPTAENLANGSYSMVKKLCLVLPRQPTAAALSVVAFANSAPAQRIFAALGAVPAEIGD